MIMDNKKKLAQFQTYELKDIWSSGDAKEEYHEWSEVKKRRTNKRSKYIPSALPAIEKPGHAESYHPDEIQYQKLLVSAINQQILKRNEYEEVTSQVRFLKKNDPQSSLHELSDLKDEEDEDEEDEEDEENTNSNEKKHQRIKGYVGVNARLKKIRNLILSRKHKRRAERKLVPFTAQFDKAIQHVEKIEKKRKRIEKKN